jgi:Zn-dependent protease with chaperone function
VLLPLVYVAIVVLTGWSVYLYAIHGAGFILSGSGGGFYRLLLYVGPLIVGAILVAFMIKPLFAPRMQAGEPVEIDLEREPVLRDMIRDICAQVGAPMPTEVNVDCQVNASARLRRGWLSLGRGDLALTIGLPLAANLSARELAGVLAHEFGHFAQGGGMALTYTIRSINEWFARVVFGRDQWDAALDRMAASGDVRVALILQGARGAVWLSRRVLHGLLYAGHAVSCLQLRQMEYDADYYEVHVAGSDDFVHTSQELARINATAQNAFGELSGLWGQRRLVDDLPAFIALRRTQLPADTAEKISAAQLAAKTSWRDTHPSDADRIAHARTLGQPGIFRGEGPATLLFADFSALSRHVTAHHYRANLELTFDDSNLVTTASAARTGDAEQAMDAALRRLGGPVLDLARPLVWREQELAAAGPATPVEARLQLLALRTEIDRLRPPAETTSQAVGLLRQELENAMAARAFLRDGVQVKAAAFNLPASELTVAEKRVAEIQVQLARREGEASAFERAVHAWILTIVRTVRLPELASALPAGLAERCELNARALVGLRPWLEAFPEWMEQYSLFSLYLANAKSLTGNDRFMRGLDLQRIRVRDLARNAPRLIGDTPHPFAEQAGAPTVAAALDKALVGVDLDGRLALQLRFTGALYFRILRQLAVDGEIVESLLAASPSHPCPAPANPAAPSS